MIIAEDVIRRLAFIRYLYKVAYDQSKRPDPLCAASILTFHDAIELFLQLASEKVDVGKERISFMDYWDILLPQLPEGGLTQKESVRRLNRARVALKHHGNLPSSSDIEAFRATATNFFEENTSIVWNIRFNEVSLVELVKNESVNMNLKESEKLLHQQKMEEALGKAAIAFRQLIDEYGNTKRIEYGYSPFSFGEDFTFHSSFFMDVRDHRLSAFIDKVVSSIDQLSEALRILSWGIDYRRYVKFQLLTPMVERNTNGEYITNDARTRRGSKHVISIEDVNFCIDFVIESAIVLQEFDFKIEEYWR